MVPMVSVFFIREKGKHADKQLERHSSLTPTEKKHIYIHIYMFIYIFLYIKYITYKIYKNIKIYISIHISQIDLIRNAMHFFE